MTLTEHITAKSFCDFCTALLAEPEKITGWQYYQTPNGVQTVMIRRVGLELTFQLSRPTEPLSPHTRLGGICLNVDTTRIGVRLYGALYAGGVRGDFRGNLIPRAALDGILVTQLDEYPQRLLRGLLQLPPERLSDSGAARMRTALEMRSLMRRLARRAA